MPSGTLKNAYRAHKTVVRLPESPAMFKLWALVADAQARLHVAEGKRFFSAAPIAYAAYRDNRESIWVPTSTDRRRKSWAFAVTSHRPRNRVGCRRARISGDGNRDSVATNMWRLGLPRFEGIRRETNQTYSAHPLPKTHSEEPSPGGPRNTRHIAWVVKFSLGHDETYQEWDVSAAHRRPT